MGASPGPPRPAAAVSAPLRSRSASGVSVSQGQNGSYYNNPPTAILQRTMITN